ncbi:MAG: 2-hydroxychromene-2-carboxylate isomerase [Polyangiaceae bacterium]|jgi:2-hydroxychromene-2-carboxylate isomerase|nr:2-hydroxychromene-2-carboxylate isomerase [Polyangiaceae bacterium]
MAKPRLEFFFDFASTYSYLASTQLDAMAERAGAEILWRPMVLGAVFQGAGNDMPAKVAAKAPYLLRDIERWAKHYGVPFKMSSHWPCPTIAAERLTLVADESGKGPAFAKAVFRAMWAEDRNINDEAELSKLLAEVGLDPAAALARSKSPEIKERLRTNTDLALSRGAFGAPAMFVGEELFWGNDRLHFVEDALKRAGA